MGQLIYGGTLMGQLIYGGALIEHLIYRGMLMGATDLWGHSHGVN